MVMPTRPGSPGPTPDALVHLAAITRAAGAATLEFYERPGLVQQKADSSPLTAADVAAHRLLYDALRAWDPAIPIISEEGTIPGPEERRAWNRFWLVDPLDGTKEFIHRNGEFTVNVALIDGGVTVLGAVAAPAIDQLYYAAAGLGSWKRTGDGQPERLLSRAAPADAPLRVIESRSHPSPELEAFLADFHVAERVKAGSSLKFCLVAEGLADIYPRLGPTMEWDVAAGDCIFRNSGELGPRFSPITYNKADLRNPDFVIGLEGREAEVGSL